MDVQGAPSLIVRAIIGGTVVVVTVDVAMMVAVMTMVVAAMVVVIIMTMVDMVMIAIGVIVKQKVQVDAGGRPIGHADDRRQRKHEHHRPDQGNAASARSFQSRQHAVR